MDLKNIKIAVIGLGYVGLPVAIAFARKFSATIGYDNNQRKIELFKKGQTYFDEVNPQELKETSLKFTYQLEDLTSSNFFVVCVPTPVDAHNKPDLSPLREASRMLGKVIKPGSIVVYESTVYPGVTEEICGPIIAEVSGLQLGIDFHLGYSPERINPGDTEHRLETIIKVVSGDNVETLEAVAQVYHRIVEAGVHRAPSIKVAEAAKVIENTQRDLNIALMNELSIIFDRMNIATKDVLAAAGTKWNFLKFVPGLVGGHCIGVDPYYLTTKAEQLGYHPQVILAGRRINDTMGRFVAERLIKLMVNSGSKIKGARVGILGITFKENVADLRNSRVPDIVKELEEFGAQPIIHDPLADAHEARDEYGIELSKWEDLCDLEGLVLAVNHQEYLSRPISEICGLVLTNGVIADVRNAFDKTKLRKDILYWSL